MTLCEISLKILSNDYDIPLDEIRKIVSNSPDLETIYFKLDEIIIYN